MDYIIVSSEDWEGLYQNGKLLTQGHSISGEEYLFFVLKSGEKANSLKTVVCDQEWVEESGYLPENFEDVKVTHTVCTITADEAKNMLGLR